ncbi:hypothetical protein FN846DRAFT_905152 [Sphaerosporella brunnea]|uniref:Uncharacterized protein n=1 Tax=Sphaerosporella brunnea TaxID=1250544 RepID=A0A5J5F224_9PEZI|nr:hypothetical protein FN846DRAFT_905152 [Sphaerosporella brunnea]
MRLTFSCDKPWPSVPDFQGPVLYLPLGQLPKALLPISHPANLIYLPGDTQHPGYVPQHDTNHRPGSMAQWMAAIWVGDSRGFFGREVPPGMRFIQSMHLVVVIIRYMSAGDAGRPAPMGINSRFSTELAETQGTGERWRVNWGYRWR